MLQAQSSELSVQLQEFGVKQLSHNTHWLGRRNPLSTDKILQLVHSSGGGQNSQYQRSPRPAAQQPSKTTSI
uniref:Uncharacterized protein n=1 Tax=Timema tahoe TaxID=61484 RepID=A0A7R9FKK5_9NEOP|nr:unnamed protein product [Timema tahoe]